MHRVNVETPWRQVRPQLVAMIAAAATILASTSANALVVQRPDGSYADGCGVAHNTVPGVAKLAERVAMQKSYVSPTGWFRIHYDVVGDNAVSTSDANLNGVPDWVETVAEVADSARDSFYTLGYLTSLNDRGGEDYGGGLEYDIYLIELSSQYVYGIAWNGTDRYMHLDNDYAEPIYLNKGKTGLRVTVAHELFHAVQFTYSYYSNWWNEATATFMEDVLYPDVNDYWQYLDPAFWKNTLFEDPSIPLYSTSSLVRDAHMYGVSVFCHFIEENYPESGLEAIRYTYTGYQSYGTNWRSALEEKTGDELRDILASFWAWSYFTGERSRPGLFFEDAAGYAPAPPNALEDTDWQVRYLSSLGSTLVDINVERMGGFLTSIVPDGSPGGVRIDISTFNGRGVFWSFRLIAANEDTVHILEPVDGHFEVGRWNSLTDLVLVAGYDGTSGGAATARYDIEYDPDLTQSTLEKFQMDVAQNTPNPFNPTTIIPFRLTGPANMSIDIYDIAGRRIRSITAGELFGEGEHAVVWDGTTDTGLRAGSGTYLARFRSQHTSSTIRMVLIR